MSERRRSLSIRFEAESMAWIKNAAQTINAGLPGGDGFTLGARPERPEPMCVVVGLAEIAAPSREDAIYLVCEPLRKIEGVQINVMGSEEPGEPDLIVRDHDIDL
jgi:hypothetical protein